MHKHLWIIIYAKNRYFTWALKKWATFNFYKFKMVPCSLIILRQIGIKQYHLSFFCWGLLTTNFVASKRIWLHLAAYCPKQLEHLKKKKHIHRFDSMYGMIECVIYASSRMVFSQSMVASQALQEDLTGLGLAFNPLWMTIFPAYKIVYKAYKGRAVVHW